MIFKRFRKKKKAEIPPPPRIIYKQPANIETLMAKIKIDADDYEEMTDHLGTDLSEKHIKEMLVSELTNELLDRIDIYRDYSVKDCSMIFATTLKIVKENEYE